MKAYIVTFEVEDEGRIEELVESLRKYYGYCPIHKGCWAILTEKSAVDIRDSLGEVLIEEDRIFVIKSGVESAWRNTYSKKHDEWLKREL